MSSGVIVGRLIVEKIHAYADRQRGWKYDVIGYLFTAAGAISMFCFHRPFRVVDRHLFCWENLAESDRYMGKQLQLEEEPVLISRIIDALERSSCK